MPGFELYNIIIIASYTECVIRCETISSRHPYRHAAVRLITSESAIRPLALRSSVWSKIAKIHNRHVTCSAEYSIMIGGCAPWDTGKISCQDDISPHSFQKLDFRTSWKGCVVCPFNVRCFLAILAACLNVLVRKSIIAEICFRSCRPLPSKYVALVDAKVHLFICSLRARPFFTRTRVKILDYIWLRSKLNIKYR